MLEVRDLSVSFMHYDILKDISFHIDTGDWLMIIGPNGAGKTTIANAIAQSIDYSGEIVMEGVDLKDLSPIERAKNIGVLMQTHYVSYGYKVEDVVSLGAYSRKSNNLLNRKMGKNELKRIERAMELTGIEKLRNRSVLTLSGGELQRVFLSQLIVQNPKIMILDEPTNHLDLVYQEKIFDLIDHWRQKEDRAVISVVHDLRLARMYGSKALLIDGGSVHSFGSVERVMTPEHLKEVYKIDVYDWMNRLNSYWQ